MMTRRLCFQAAFLLTVLAAGEEVDLSCLSLDNKGCPSLVDPYLCLASADGRNETIAGRKVQGQACVWCNGGLCNEKGAKCEPFDLQMNGEGSAFTTSYVKQPLVAQCQEGVVKGHFEVEQPKLDPPKMDNLGCLTVKPAGCMAIKDKLTCLSSLDGSAAASFGGLAIRGQPCVWCGGQPCTDAGDFPCAPYEYLSKGAGKAFPHLAAMSITVAECHAQEFVFTEEDVGCLKSAETGCNQIKDFETCTSSKEGRPYEYVAGFKVRGEPCVWCGGGLCHDGAPNVCEPYDYALHGVGSAFNTKYSSASLFYKASCDQDQKPRAEGLPPDWQVHGIRMHVDCGKPWPVWDKVGARCGFCKTLVPSLNEKFHSCAEYCEKQGGLQCKSAALGSINSCDVKEQISCDYAFQVYQHGICECAAQQKFEDLNSAFTAALPPPSEADQKCLKDVEVGCRRIKDQQQCLSSRDAGWEEYYRGIKVRGQPCVWCGGTSCTSRDPDALCEAYDYLAKGQGLAFVTRYATPELARVASCKNATAGKAGGPSPQAGVQAMYGQCGGTGWKGYTICEVGAVCNVVSADFSQCVPAATVKAGVRVTAPDPLQETLGAAAPPLSSSGQVISDTAASCSSHPKCAGLKLAGDCCPNPAGATLDCCSNYQPSDLILEPTKATPATELEAAPPAGAGAGAGADWWKSRPSQEQCMLPEPQGCGSIRHKLMCLSRVDGRYGYQPHGIAVGGSPCVWCGGGPCTSYSDAVCEPQSWLKQGQGKAFATLNAATGWLVAKCQEDRNAVFDNLACLRRSENGCNKIQEKHQCLSSTDARPYVEVAGFKARDQPCVWCGGGICHSNNANLCEPYDFVMNGAGQAFSYNLGYNTYMVAECQGTEVMPMSYPHAEQDAGLPTQVRCTGATSTWNGVGKVCGDCSVTVPNIYVSFRSCGEYCAAQGGLRCLSAKKAFTHSCEVQSQYSMTCDSTFEQGEFGRCECGSGQASAEMVTRAARLPQMPYAQCGGQQWTGLTKCQSGSSCLVINSWYSQCLPGAQSNPDQAAQAAKNAAQAAGMDLEDQAKAAGEAATKAAASAGQQAQGQATRAYVAAAGTAAISGLPTPKASGIGEQAAQDAAAQAGLSGDEAAKTTEEAVKQGKVIVFGDEQTSEGAEIAGTAAANHAKDIGKTAEEQCVKAYGAAATFAEVSGKSLEQKAQLAAGVAARAAQRAGLAGEAQVRCVVAAAQENSKAHGEFADVTANTMHHAGVAAATEAGIDPTQVDTIVSVSIQETEHSGAQKVTIPQDVIDNCMAAGEAAVDGPSAAAMVATIAGKLRGMSAADTARAARKCVYDAAIAKGMTPEQAAAAAEAAASTAASAVMRPANNSRLPPHPLERAGEDCWTACGKKSGLCAFCGIGNACCRKDELNPTKECRDIQTFHTWHHECVQPVHQPQDVNDVGHSVKEAVEYAKATGEAEKAVEETQAAGGGVESQVEAAGKAAAQSVKEGGLNTADQVTSAYKSAEDAAKSAGMSAPEADAAAEKVSQEVAEAAGMTEQEAAAAAAAAAAVVHGRPLVKPTTAPQLPPQAATGETILPNPVPESMKEGIAAAEAKKAENAPVHDQAVAAAGATGAYAVADKASQDTAKDQATKAAEYVAHKDGLPMDEAKSEAEKAVQEAITSQGGHFVEQPILPDPVPAPIQAGIEAARIEKAQDKPLHDQAVAAAGTTGSQAVADKATQEAAKDQATKAAEYVAHQEGLPIDEAKSEAAKAVQEAIDSQGGHFVENPILPDPVPESIKAGIAAAEAEKAQAKPMHDQAVAAAGATGSYAVADKASQDIAKDQAAQAAEYIAHKDGLPLNEAKSEAVKAVQEAIAAQGGQFVENPILPHPVPEPIEAGIAAANAAKAEAKPTHDQAVAAAGATGSSAVADKATQEVAKDEATEAAEYISHQDGLPIHEAKTEATKAVQEAIDEQGGRFVVDHVDILPDPVPESIKAGIAAAEAEKAQAKPMHDQAVAAAGATGSYAVGDQATQEIARDQATKAAEYIAHKEGLPIKEAEDEAAKAVQEAINAQGGHFVENPILPDPVPESIKAGIAAAEAEKAQAKPMHDQAVAAAGATGSYAVADKATQEVAKDQATKAAEYIAHNEGLPINEAKSEAVKAVQEAINAQGGQFVEKPILPDPVPKSIEAGIAAAEAAKAEAKPTHDQAVAAAGATGTFAIKDAATQEVAQDQATKAAEYVAHKDGLPIHEAKSEAAAAVQEAMDTQGGRFVAHHIDILPDPVPESIKAGIEAAKAEEAQEKPLHAQAVAAAGATGSYAIADKATQEVAKDQATKAAEYIAYQDGLPIHEAKAEAAAAVQEAITAQGGHFVEPQILPDPIPQAMKEGIAAAETKKAQSAPMHDQAVAAAGATGAKAVQEEDTETAQRDATKVAEYVIHNEGVAITKAREEAVKAMQEAESAGFFAHQRVRNTGQDCWEQCGRPGYCTFCGRGACCKAASAAAGEGPSECQGVRAYATTGYECVSPTDVFGPVKSKEEASTNDGAFVISGSDTSTEAEKGGRSVGSWLLILGFLVSLCICCVAGVCLVRGKEVAKPEEIVPKRVTRAPTGGVAKPLMGNREGQDLELQAPLRSGGALGNAPVASYGQAPWSSRSIPQPANGSISPSAYRAAASQGYVPAPTQEDQGPLASSSRGPVAMASVPMASMASVPMASMASVPMASQPQIPAMPAQASALGPMAAGAAMAPLPAQAGALLPWSGFEGLAAQFDRIDQNHDGRLNHAEWDGNMQAAVPAPASQGPSPSVVCANCGNRYAPDAAFCRKCGVQRPMLVEPVSR